MDAYEPHNWIGLLGLIVISAGAIIPAWLAAHRGRKATTQAGEVLEQVRNGHEVPLRADVDHLIRGQQAIADLLTDTHGLVVEHSREIGRIRDDITVLKKTHAAD